MRTASTEPFLRTEKLYSNLELKQNFAYPSPTWNSFQLPLHKDGLAKYQAHLSFLKIVFKKGR
jgi:hypothetical protein